MVWYSLAVIIIRTVLSGRDEVTHCAIWQPGHVVTSRGQLRVYMMSINKERHDLYFTRTHNEDIWTNVSYYYVTSRCFNNRTCWQESVVIWSDNFAPFWHRPTVNWLNNNRPCTIGTNAQTHRLTHIDEHTACYFSPSKHEVSYIADMVYLAIFLLSAVLQLTKLWLVSVEFKGFGFYPWLNHSASEKC
jgi:hypothetical protein